VVVCVYIYCPLDDVYAFLFFLPFVAEIRSISPLFPRIEDANPPQSHFFLPENLL
jgi:hypothetical protein